MPTRPMLRTILALILLALALPLAAQKAPPPPKLEPLPQLPPPPPGAADQPEEPPVRIRSGQDQVEEQLIDGRHVVRVTTPQGQEYWLVEDLGDGPGVKNESLDHGVRVPLWVIRRF